MHKASPALLALYVIAVSVVACSEAKVATAPPSRAMALRLSNGESFDVDVSSDITLLDGNGNARKKYKHKASLEVTVEDGFASTKSKKGYVVEAARRNVALFNAIEDVADSINLTPVVGVTTDELSDYYSESVQDDQGNSITAYGTSPTEGSPVTQVSTYLNGNLVGTTEMNWTPVTGGFLLADQTLTGYDSGSSVSVIHSTIDHSTIEFVQTAGIRARFASVAHSALNKAVCLILPNAAYAGLVGCVEEGLVFAGETVALGAGTAAAGAITGPGAVAVYLTGWSLWTHGMYRFLKCLNRRT